MIKKLLITAALAIMATAASVSAEEGYIFQLKDNAILPFSVTEGVESLVADEAIYRADSLEDVYKFADKSAIKCIGRDVPLYLFDDDDFEKPNDPAYVQGYQWNIDKINIMPVWKKGYRGENATVCVIDSGLNVNHEDISREKIISTYNVFDGSEDVTDNMGHGTMVTGIISAKINNKKAIAGIADKSNIISIKAFDDLQDTNTSTLIKVLDKVCDTEGIDVLNMSLGTSPGQTIDPATVKMFQEAIDKVVNKGIIVIASVGNAGNEELSYPAALSNVIGVGAVSKNKLRCAFSQHNDSVFVVAPGGNENSLENTEDGITSLYNDTNSIGIGSGTSHAAPHVSAVAAIAKSIYPDLTAEWFMDILKETSEDLGDRGYDTYYGYGLIDAEKIIDAVKKLSLNPPTPKPTPTPTPIPTPTPVPKPTPTPGFQFDPDNYVELEYDKESGAITVETYDREAVLYAAKFDGAKLVSVQKFALNTIGDDDSEIYTIYPEEEPTKLFLWHGMIGCMGAWVNKDYVVSTAEPTLKPTPDIDDEHKLINSINEEREKAGAAPLIEDEAGMSVSKMIAVELINGRNPFEVDGKRKGAADYIGDIVNKSVSVNYNKIDHVYNTTSSAVSRAIFASSEYSAVLLSPQYTHIGVGLAKDKELDKSKWIINLIYYPED